MILWIFIIAGLRIVLEAFVSRSSGEFLFARFWFLSFLFILDFHLQKRFGVFSRRYFLFPLVAFTLSSVLDHYFLFRDFDSGVPLNSFLRSSLSLFVFAQGVPKLSLITVWIARFLSTLYFILKSPRSFLFRSIRFMFMSYFAWQVFHLSIFYVKSSFLVKLGLEAEPAHLINGFIYFTLVFLMVNFTNLKVFVVNFLMYELREFSFLYNLLVSFIGYLLGDRSYLLKVVIPLSSVLSFRSIELFVKILRRKIVDQNYNLSDLDLIVLFLSLSLIVSLRGIFLMTLPFVLLLMFIYYVPPIELGKNLVGPFFTFVFFFFLTLVAYLSLEKDFFITSEAIAVGFGCGLYAFFEGMIKRVSGTIKRIFASAAAILPLFFLHDPEDIAVYFFFALFSFLAPNLKHPRVISAAYFVGRLYYLKSTSIF